ncbi:MAG: hypothetical protein HUK00_05630 [Bacteroidaceae bacterium]|nr:hypothetical protein [Bacteroidaceae bacterium]
MTKKDYLQPEIKVLLLRHASMLAESTQETLIYENGFNELEPAEEDEETT